MFTLERLLMHHYRDCKVDLLLTRSCAFEVGSPRSHGRLNELKSSTQFAACYLLKLARCAGSTKFVQGPLKYLEPVFIDDLV